MAVVVHLSCHIKRTVKIYSLERTEKPKITCLVEILSILA
jgi:hypothetical protein